MGTIPLLYGPGRIWLNTTVTGTLTEPDIEIDNTTNVLDDPDAVWVELGNSGNLGYSSDGVRLEVAESLTDIFTDGTTMAVDTRRTEESILLTATLMEDSLDLRMFRMAFNYNEVDEVPESPTVEGSRAIDLYQGPHVRKFQFLARAMSDPDQEDGPFPVQLWIPTVRLAGSISSAFVKGDPLMVEASFHGVVSQGFGSREAAEDHGVYHLTAYARTHGGLACIAAPLRPDRGECLSDALPFCYHPAPVHRPRCAANRGGVPGRPGFAL